MNQTSPNFPIIFTAFHGTALEVAKKIVSEKKITPKFRRDHWLGQGVYFFKDDYSQALFWADYKIKNTIACKGETSAVVYTLIETENNSMLNLDSREDWIYFSQFIRKLRDFMIKEKIKLTIKDSSKKELYFQCYYCDKLPKKFKLIQRTFKVNSKIYDNDDNLKQINMYLNGTQICVRDDDIINYEAIGIKSLSYSKEEFLIKRDRTVRKKLISFEEGSE